MPSKKKSSTDKISSDKLCSFTGLTDRRHRQLAKEGVFPPPIGSQYDHDATLVGLFKYFRTKQESSTGGMAEAKLKREQAKARTAEVEAKKAEESVIDVSEAKRGFSRMAVVIKAKLLAIPSSMAPLAAGKSAAEVEGITRKAVVDALQQLSDHFLNKK